MGFGPNRVRSLPDGVAQVLAEYLENKENLDPPPYPQIPTMELELDFERSNGNDSESPSKLPLESGRYQIGDLCPECGQAAVVNEEGCRKCYACGYSEC